jgi:prevent-host-death family protein
MVTVGSRELKNRLGKYLGLVRKGQSVQVTDRGTRVALLVPAPQSGAARNDNWPTRIAELVARGAIRPGKGKLTLYPPIKLKPGKSLSEIISEDRERRLL